MKGNVGAGIVDDSRRTGLDHGAHLADQALGRQVTLVDLLEIETPVVQTLQVVSFVHILPYLVHVAPHAAPFFFFGLPARVRGQHTANAHKVFDLHLQPRDDDGQCGGRSTLNVIDNIRAVVSVHEFNGVSVDGLQCLGHLEFGTLVGRQFADAFQQRLQCSKRAGVALDDHIQLVTVVFALEQRLFVPGQDVSQRYQDMKSSAGCRALALVFSEVLEAVILAAHGDADPASVEHLLAAEEITRVVRATNERKTRRGSTHSVVQLEAGGGQKSSGSFL